MKKSLSIILSLLLLLTSCGGPAETPETSDDTQPDTSVQPDESSPSEDQPVQDAKPSYTEPGHDYSVSSPAVPEDMNFNGTDFYILSGYANDYWPVTVEDYTANAVNYATYTAQLHTEERMNVKIIEELWLASAGLLTELTLVGRDKARCRVGGRLYTLESTLEGLCYLIVDADI